jgi:adenosine kinase
VRTSELRHTARFVCTTDADQAQIASFYAGAMSEARDIELGPLASVRGGRFDLVLIGANDPEAMLRHTEECRTRGYPFAADPSQQLAFADGQFIRRLIDGATYLFSNEYEAHLTEQKTGWTADEILSRVGVRITTLGSKGVRIERRGEPSIEVPVAQELRKADPTGVGDAFRAGFLTALSWRLDLTRCAQVGSMLATYVIETVGTQEYELARGGFLQRFTAAYGRAAAVELEPFLAISRA